MIGNLIATLIGGLISLLAVLLTLRHNQKLQQQALEDERAKIKEERAFVAKQGALLEASEAISRFIDFLVRIPDIALEGGGKVTPEIGDLQVAFNKLHFYCSLPTIACVTQLGQQINRVQNEVLASKIPVEIERGNLQGIDIQIQGLEKTSASIDEEIKALLASDPQSTMLIHHREQLAQVHRDAAESWRQRGVVLLKQMELTEQCRDIVIANLTTIHKALRDMLLFARDELSFDIDKNAYEKLMSDSTDKVLNDLQELLSKVRTEVAQAVAST